MRALIAIKVIEPSNFDEILKSHEYLMLRQYLSDFKRTTKGEFISEASVVKYDEGKYTILKDSLDFKLCLQDWNFNEPDESIPFHKAYHMKWTMHVLCEI